MRFFFALLVIFNSLSVSASQWLKLDDKTHLIVPNVSARYLTSNQAILLGKKCAVVIDAHGDFTALENVVSEIKKRINLPICHLISTSSDTEQILGMMLLAHHFPDANWYVPAHVSEQFPYYKNALKEKLERFKKSLELSKARFSSQQNKALQQRLKAAEQRIEAWQKAELSYPSSPVRTPIKVELGEHLISLNALEGATGSDLIILSHFNSGLFAGLTANSIPYVQDTDLAAWLTTLEQLRDSEEIVWLLPSQGKPFKIAALHKPIHFLQSVLKNESTEVPVSLVQLYKNDNITQTRLRLMYELAKTKQAQKMQKQGTVL